RIYSTDIKIVSAAAARNTTVKNTANPSSNTVSPNAPSSAPRKNIAIQPATASPARLVQTSTPFSFGSVKRSSSSTTSAAAITSAAGSSGSKLALTSALHCRGFGPKHRRRQRLRFHSRERRARRAFDARQKRLRINAHEDDQR